MPYAENEMHAAFIFQDKQSFTGAEKHPIMKSSILKAGIELRLLFAENNR